jgi:hypothetical protein
MIVPGLSFGIVFYLLEIGLAQTNDTDSIGAKAKHHYMQTLATAVLCRYAGAYLIVWIPACAGMTHLS